MAETMCVSGAVKVKAGANVSTSLTAAHYTQFINQAESQINAATRINYTDTYAALNADVQKLLEDVCSSLAAMQAISYNMAGYSSRYEAETMLDVQRDTALRGISLLRDKKTTDFVNGA
jgi:hypothetical protein